MKPVKALINAILSKLRRSPRTTHLLERFGIDPMRYWLLADLFAELSERGGVNPGISRIVAALRS